MCGIFIFVSRDPLSVEEIVKVLEPLLRNRGPNCTNRLTITLRTNENGVLYITFIGTVLWLRGGSLLPQPYVDSVGNVLLWNGDVFEGEILSDDESTSDTKLLGDALENTSDETLIEVHSKTNQTLEGFILK
jgi:asparagine synthetase B (glutamine-hydrolysing)